MTEQELLERLESLYKWIQQGNWEHGPNGLDFFPRTLVVEIHDLLPKLIEGYKKHQKFGKAMDIILCRGWGFFPIDKDRTCWGLVLGGKEEPEDFHEIWYKQSESDPCELLIKADEWYNTHVEKKHDIH